MLSSTLGKIRCAHRAVSSVAILFYFNITVFAMFTSGHTESVSIELREASIRSTNFFKCWVGTATNGGRYLLLTDSESL